MVLYAGETFNSLFEMPMNIMYLAHHLIYTTLSILYLRCETLMRLFRQRNVAVITFNSLFEMHVYYVLREAAEHFENTLSILYLRCEFHEIENKLYEDVVDFQFSI